MLRSLHAWLGYGVWAWAALISWAVLVSAHWGRVLPPGGLLGGGSRAQQVVRPITARAPAPRCQGGSSGAAQLSRRCALSAKPAPPAEPAALR
jgi:hypothetical protein